MRDLEITYGVSQLRRGNIHFFRIDAVLIGRRQRKFLGMFCDMHRVVMMFPRNLVQFLLEFIHKIEQFVFPVVRQICLGYFFPDVFNCPVRHFSSPLTFSDRPC